MASEGRVVVPLSRRLVDWYYLLFFVVNIVVTT